MWVHENMHIRIINLLNGVLCWELVPNYISLVVSDANSIISSHFVVRAQRVCLKFMIKRNLFRFTKGQTQFSTYILAFSNEFLTFNN